MTWRAQCSPGKEEALAQAIGVDLGGARAVVASAARIEEALP
jgi:hypothetical protein